MSKILFLIDCQYDFIDGGSLAVNGSKEIMDKLAKFIRDAHEEYDSVFLTVDWHPQSHCSFKENGGIWPAHCVQFSHGASIYQPILDALNDRFMNYTILTKGLDEDHEEYSVFKNTTSKKYIETINSITKPTQVDFCGIALDYCVISSAIDSKKVFTNSDVRILKEFSPSIGNPDETIKKCTVHNIEVV